MTMTHYYPAVSPTSGKYHRHDGLGTAHCNHALWLEVSLDNPISHDSISDFAPHPFVCRKCAASVPGVDRVTAPAPMVGLLLLDARQQMIEGGPR